MTDLERLGAELHLVTESAEAWRAQVLVQERQIARLEKKVARQKCVIAGRDARVAELELEALRNRCMFELMSTAKRFGERQISADEMRVEVAAVIDRLRAGERGS